jgi:Na+/H+-dicarboxylate symporter
VSRTGAAKRPSKLITYGGPVGLLVGLLLGALAHSGKAPWLSGTQPWIEPIGRLWMNALSVAVVPLTVCLLVVGVCSLPTGRSLGKWGGRTIAWFVAMLVGAGALTAVVTGLYLAYNQPSPLTLTGASPAPAGAAASDWVDQFVPSNFFAAAASGDVLPLAILSVLFGLALRSIGEERRRPVEQVFVGVRDTVLAFVHWVVLAIPIGAFALTFSFAAESGLATAGALVHFTVYVSVLMLVVVGWLAAATVIVSRRKVNEMVAALSPLVSVAAGTRSSLASLPTLVESANQIGLPEPATEIVLPTAVSLFKLNRTISATAKVMFMAAAVGVVISPQALVVFVGTIVLLSFATPGLPAGGSNATWGAYLAAGVPIEVVVFFDVTDGITDIIKTVLNVVADFAVAVFVSRGITQTQTCTSSSALAASEELAC